MWKLLAVNKSLFRSFLKCNLHRSLAIHPTFWTWCPFLGHMIQQRGLLQSESNKWSNVHSSATSSMPSPWIQVSIFCQHAVCQWRKKLTLKMMMSLVILFNWIVQSHLILSFKGVIISKPIIKCAVFCFSHLFLSPALNTSVSICFSKFIEQIAVG